MAAFKIFDALSLNEEVPTSGDLSQFNAVKILLKGGLHADLDWKEATASAERYVSQGLRLFWEIDLGLFAGLPQPLSDQGQFFALGLALEHFRDHIWKDYKEQSIGLCLYRGSIDFSHVVSSRQDQEKGLQDWIESCFQTIDLFRLETGIDVATFHEMKFDHLYASSPVDASLLTLHSADVAAEYLVMLANRLPDEIPLFILLDAETVHNPYLLGQLSSKERFGQIQPLIKGSRLPLEEYAWEQSNVALGYLARKAIPSLPLRETKIGVCLPALTVVRPIHYYPLQMAMDDLIKVDIHFRVIPESSLISSWDGLDYLIVDPALLGPQGKRKLQGFCAAGGTVLSLGEAMGLPQELPFSVNLLFNSP